MAQTKTDKQRADEARQNVGTGSNVDPAYPETQENHGLPEGVSTKASRGDIESTYEEPEGQPLLTVEEQLAGGTDEQLDAVSPSALAEDAEARRQAREESVERSAKAQQSALKGERGSVERTTVERESKAESKS